MKKEDLRIGMYARLKANNVTYIRKIVEICDDIRYATYRVDKPFCNQTGLSPKKIIGEPSYDILDLIKVGDIIAIKEDIDNFNKTFVLGIFNLELLKQIKDKLIKNELRLIQILTHEQFEQNCYKIGD